MKKSQLLNKIYLTILVFFLLLGTVTHAEDPADIWKIEENSKKKIESSEIIKKDEKKIVTGNSVYEMQSENNSLLNLCASTRRERNLHLQCHHGELKHHHLCQRWECGLLCCHGECSPHFI